MKHLIKATLATATLALAAIPAHAADGVITYKTDQDFDDVTFGLENAIIEAGLVIDHVSHTGDMLERTRGDVGSDVTIFQHADIYSFCSAAVSRKVMEADPMNVVFCPYDVFVMQLPDSEDVVVGFREYPEGPMQDVQKMLDDIVKSALGTE
ncbi:DUF302 domain-containing protein [Rhodalgimonas zhirmunskyi]|uniref:DUF302 domain-containing protein n=1 Tax=Rhodalgimonas zhirmunskyi TaxID=2964767 RepID=A0AAJ1UD09_9RHOB|nr:DUF302 domain-containing protein [Rhodoalgimonas zhirmunskyi]MDQ2093902.1 DUF302 domain-containing protein [Rhodoalgimonas zhirmunskyi]